MSGFGMSPRGTLSPRNSGMQTPVSKVGGDAADATEDKKGAVLIGDTVALWDEAGEGILMGDGVRHGNTRCWISRSTHIEMVNGLFEVSVPRAHKARDAFLAYAAHQVSVPPEADIEKLTDELLIKLPFHMKHIVTKLAGDFEKENETNEYETRRCEGQVLTYGAVVELKHVKSGRLLSVAAPDESSRSMNRELMLSLYSGEGTWWRVQPSYKLQLPGDAVRYNAGINFISAANPHSHAKKKRGTLVLNGMERNIGLHFSNRPLTDPSHKATLGSGFHVSAFEDPTPVKMALFQSVSAKSDQLVNGGQVVRLFHRQTADSAGDYTLALRLVVTQTELYLGCSGGEAVHLIDQKPGSLPIFTLWRFEQEDTSSGAVAEYNGICRFRHLVTGKYLCMLHTTDGVIPDMETIPGPGTLFSLLPVFVTSGPIGCGSIIYIRHRETGQYLHAQNAFARRSHGGGADFGEEYRQEHLRGSHVLHKENGFSMKTVEKSLLHDVQLVSDAARGFSAFLELLESNDDNVVHRSRFTASHICDLLDTIKTLCSKKHTADEWTDVEIKRHIRSQRQGLVRQLGVLSNIVSVCKAAHAVLGQSRQPPAAWGDKASLVSVMSACHDTIKEILLDNVENSVFLLVEFDELQRWVVWEPGGEGPGGAAARTLLTLIQGSKEAVKNLTEDQVEFFLEGMESDVVKRAEYARFISHFCHCHGEGHRQNQATVIKNLLRDRDRSKMLPSFRTSDKKISISIVITTALQLEMGLPTRSFGLEALSRATDGSAEKKMYDLLLSMIDLFVNVCAGCNWEARALIQNHAPYDVLAVAVADDVLPYALRATMTNLMTNLYVERGPADYLCPQSATQLLNEVDSASAVTLPEPLFQPDKELSGFRHLKTAAVTGMALASKPDNQDVPALSMIRFFYILSTCRLASHLLRLGFFSTADEIQNTLLPRILAVLDIRPQHAELAAAKSLPTDLFAANNFDSQTMSSAECALMDAKKSCLEMLVFILDLRSSIRIPLLLTIYKGAIAATGPVDKLAEGNETHRVAEKMRQNGRDEMIKAANYLSFARNEQLSKCLVETLKNPYPGLAPMAMSVLFRERSSNLELYKLLFNVQILIDPAAISSYKHATRHMTVMRRYTKDFLETVATLTAGNPPSPSDLGDAQRRELGAAIEECAMLCMGPASVFDSKSGQSKPPGRPPASTGDEGSKMDEHVNRETIRRAGVHEAILTIFKGCFTQEGEGAPMIFALTGTDPAAVALRRDVLAPCMKFVTNFCSNFPPAQQELFPLVHLLLACMQQGVGATKAASAVLHGNEALCNKVPESVIHDVSAAIAKASEHGGQRPHHLAFLHGLCKRSGDKQVITRNTMLILKYLSNFGPIKISSPPTAIGQRYPGAKHGSKHGHREHMLVLFRGEEGRMLRAKLVADGDTSKSGGLLGYHLELLSLIQTMLLDHSSVAFSRIQIMLPPEKVCKDVTCPDTPIEAKAVLIDIMRTLYLSDEVRHKKHPLLGEALLDLLRHLVSQMSLVPLESLSRYHVPAKTGENELVYLLTPHWAPLLLATLKHDVLGTTLSSELKNVGNLLVDRIVDLLNECNLEPKNAATFLQVIACAKQLQLSGASILSDKARQHASVSAGEVKASGAKGKSQKLSWSAAPRKLTELEMLHTFASVFLDSVDPLHVRPVGEDDEEGDHVVHRMELHKLCQSFHSTRQNAGLDAKLPLPKLGWTATLGRAPQVREFRSDEAIHLVHILRNYAKSSSAVGNDWVWNMVIGLSVLRVLAIEWRSSATEVEPPSWLLRGIPTLLLDLMERPGADDRVVHKALELGISILHGGNDSVQGSFLSLFSQRQGAPKFFLELQNRIRRGAKESRSSKVRFEALLSKGRAGAAISLELDRSIHAVLAGTNKLMNDSMDQTGISGGEGQLQESHVDLVLRFMQLLCEGHNLELQDYLRRQPESIRSVDMISATAAYIDALTPNINPFNVHIATLAMDAIAEFVQNPCRANQKVLADTKLVACANEILDIRGDVPGGEDIVGGKLGALIADFEHMTNQLKSSTVTALLSMLECIDDKYIPERMLASLDGSQLIDNMNRLMRTYDPVLLASIKQKSDTGEIAPIHIPKNLPDDFWLLEDDIEPPSLWGIGGGDLLAEEDQARRKDAEKVAQQYYIIYITLKDYDQTSRMRLRCRPEYIWDLDNLVRKVGVIEISRKSVLEKAYFIIPSVCSFITEASKQKLLLGVNRTNLQTQLSEFSENFDEFYSEMKHQRKITQQPVLNFLRRTSGIREKIFFLNAVAINVLMLVFYSYECGGTFICGDNEDLEEFRIKPGWKEVVTVLACLQCLLALTRQWWYVVERGIPLVNRRILETRAKPPSNPFWRWLVSLPEEQSNPTYRHMIKARSHGPWWLVGPEKVVFVRAIHLFTDFYFLGISAMTLTNILAIVLDLPGAPLLLMLQLLEVFNHSSVLQNVIRSITYRGNSLVQTGGLALLMFYFFGVVGFLVFPQYFMFGAADIMGGRKLEPNNNSARCTSIWKCVLIVLDIGLRKGDIGEAMDDIEWKAEQDVPDRYFIFYRMLYTFLFYTTVTTILMNIIFGIIIDTFAELREKKDQVESDIEGRCFICGIERFMFDQLSTEGNGFDNHVENDHNMWKYIFFQVYLREKNFDDYSGGESYVFSKTLRLIKDSLTHETVMDADTGLELKVSRPAPELLWFPQRDAMVLKNQKSSMEQHLMTQIRDLEVKTTKLTSHLSSQVEKVLRSVKLSG